MRPEGAVVMTESYRELSPMPDFEVRTTAFGEKLP